MRGPGTALPAVLLVGAGTEPWVVRSAAAVARAFVHTGRRVVLVDAGVQAPSLHELAGLPNDEGLGDHFAFGTSLELLARPVEDGSWSLVPAGPVSGGAIPGGRAEWQRLVAEAAERDATLLVYAPHDTPGLGELADRFGAVIGLAPDAEGRARLAAVVGRPYSVLAVLEKPGEAPPPEATSASEAPIVEPEATPAAEAPPPPGSERASFESRILPRDGAARGELIADLRARQRAALQAPPPEFPPALPPEVEGGPFGGPVDALVPTAAADPELEARTRAGEPPVVRRAAAPPRRSPARLLVLLFLLLLSVLAGAWHFRGQLSELWPRRRADVPPPAPVAAPEPAPLPVDSLDGALPFLVAVEAHQQLPAAEQRVLALRNMQAGIDFLVAPLVREGTLYYHVMAGPVADSAAAQALREDLLRRRVKTMSTPSDVRDAPLAFLVAEYATRDSADGHIARLRLLDIPAYVLPAGAEPPRWRIYAGGYGGPVEADVMRQLLQSAGVPDSLVPRTGRISR